MADVRIDDERRAGNGVLKFLRIGQRHDGILIAPDDEGRHLDGSQFFLGGFDLWAEGLKNASENLAMSWGEDEIAVAIDHGLAHAGLVLERCVQPTPQEQLEIEPREPRSQG